MSKTERLLLSNVINLNWTGLKAMPVQTNRNILLDVVFLTEQGGIRLTGKAHVMNDGVDEAFSLLIHQHREMEWWTEGGPNAQEWEPRNLTTELRHAGIADIMEAPREVQLYGNSGLRERTDQAAGLLDNCCAIEFSKALSDDVQRFVISTSDDYPCALEVIFDASEWELRKHNLEVL